MFTNNQKLIWGGIIIGIIVLGYIGASQVFKTAAYSFPPSPTPSAPTPAPMPPTCPPTPPPAPTPAPLSLILAPTPSPASAPGPAPAPGPSPSPSPAAAPCPRIDNTLSVPDQQKICKNNGCVWYDMSGGNVCMPSIMAQRKAANVAGQEAVQWLKEAKAVKMRAGIGGPMPTSFLASLKGSGTEGFCSSRARDLPMPDGSPLAGWANGKNNVNSDIYQYAPYNMWASSQISF